MTSSLVGSLRIGVPIREKPKHRRRSHLSALGFVDVHSHVVPSGDDGAQSVREGLDLVRAAARAGTRVLYATPHMHASFDQFPWSVERERLFESAYSAMRPEAAALGVTLLRGREVYPTEVPVGNVGGVTLEGTRAVLVEFPGDWLGVHDAVELTRSACESVEAEGYVPVLAHPERCGEIAESPDRAALFAERGWLLCLNAGSLLGEHGWAAKDVAWQLLEAGVVSLVASDAHRPARPPGLAGAHAVIEARLGLETADRLLGGHALPGPRDGSPGVSAEPIAGNGLVCLDKPRPCRETQTLSRGTA